MNVDDFKDIKFLKINKQFIQKFRMESQIRRLAGFPNVAYSLPIISIVDKKNEDNEQKKFNFLVKIEENSLLQNYIEKIIINIKKGVRINYFGSKASSGLNTFEVVDITKIKKNPLQSKTGKYLNLGMLLPEFEKIDCSNSFFDLHTSDRKPYEIENNVDKAICFISSGSVITINDSAKDEFDLSKSINNIYNLLYKDAIVFGNSYLEELEV